MTEQRCNGEQTVAFFHAFFHITCSMHPLFFVNKKKYMITSIDMWYASKEVLNDEGLSNHPHNGLIQLDDFMSKLYHWTQTTKEQQNFQSSTMKTM